MGVCGVWVREVGRLEGRMNNIPGMQQQNTCFDAGGPHVCMACSTYTLCRAGPHTLFVATPSRRGCCQL